MPLVEAVLRELGTHPDEKAGMLIFDSKGDMGVHLQKCLHALGRQDDLLVIGPGGNAWVPLFETFAGNTRETALYLVALGQVDGHSTGRDNDLYWLDSVVRYLDAVLVTAKAAHGCGYGGIEGIRIALRTVNAFLADDEDDEDRRWHSTQSCLAAVLSQGLANGAIDYREYMDARTSLDKEFRNIGDRTIGTIIQYAHNFLAPFEGKWVSELLTPSEGRVAYSPESLIDSGKIVLVQLSPTILGKSAIPLSSAIKLNFQRAALQRPHTYVQEEHGERKVNQTRPLLYVIDEFHTLCTAAARDGDPYFFDRAREFGVMAFVATQGISALQAVIPNSSQLEHMLNNCTTKIFFRSVNCAETSRYLERVSGTERQLVDSLSYDPAPAPSCFRLPNYAFASSMGWKRTGLSRRFEDRPRLGGELLRGLRTGEAVVLRNDGRIDHVKFSGGRYVTRKNGESEVPVVVA